MSTEPNKEEGRATGAPKSAAREVRPFYIGERVEVEFYRRDEPNEWIPGTFGYYTCALDRPWRGVVVLHDGREIHDVAPECIRSGAPKSRFVDAPDFSATLRLPSRRAKSEEAK